MPDAIELYGIYGFTHGWRRVLTVMSPSGTAAVRAAFIGNDGVKLNSAEDWMVQLHEKRAGALDRVVAANRIQIMNRADWDALRARLIDANHE